MTTHPMSAALKAAKMIRFFLTFQVFHYSRLSCKNTGFPLPKATDQTGCNRLSKIATENSCIQKKKKKSETMHQVVITN
ncbi:hypothetical protein [Kiloniella sp. b19]|uniref:hypothetical protein n=1 Tax=Kiloniella sp. GXU_MW_B19 TaxID=3141326 RepID=UPI0031DEA813